MDASNTLRRLATAGFTLVELVTVIILLSLLAVWASPVSESSSTEVIAEAEQLLNDLRYTQALSMTQGQRYYLIKQSSNTYQIMNASGTPILLPFGSTTATLKSGITFGTLTNLPNNLVAFDGRGAPYTSTGTGGTALASTATIPMTAGGNTSTVSLSPVTGYGVLQ